MGTLFKLIAMIMKKFFFAMAVLCMCLVAQSQELAILDVRTDEFSLMAERGASEMVNQCIPVSFTRHGLATAALFVKGAKAEQCVVTCKHIHAFPATLEERNSVLSGMASPTGDVELTAIPTCMCLVPRFD